MVNLLGDNPLLLNSENLKEEGKYLRAPLKYITGLIIRLKLGTTF